MLANSSQGRVFWALYEVKVQNGIVEYFPEWFFDWYYIREEPRIGFTMDVVQIEEKLAQYAVPNHLLADPPLPGM